MADFRIDIIEDIVPIEYTSHVAVESIENCPPDSEQRYNVQVLSASGTQFAMLGSYSGDAWKYLTITNIAEPSCSCVELQYNGTKLTNSDLPLKLDIEALSAINNIPLLEVVTDDYEAVQEGIQPLNVTFKVEDIDGKEGSSLLTSFQIRLFDCTTITYQTPIIISQLAHTINDVDDYIFEYYIEADGPVTSYGAIGLPGPVYGTEVSTFNSETGYIRIDTFRLADRHSIVEITFDIEATHTSAVPTTDTKTVVLTIFPFRGLDI